MYAYIKGILSHATPSQVTVETQGIGYLISIPVSVYSKLPQIGQQVHFFTSLIVREDSQALYGFLAAHDRDCFETLLGITGVGPKLAMSIIGHLAISDLQTAVANGDIPVLCHIPGVGKKTAERLLIEMRDKVPHLVAEGGVVTSGSNQDPRAQMIRDAMSALINLGYSHATSQKAIKTGLTHIPATGDLSTLITTALKHV